MTASALQQDKTKVVGPTPPVVISVGAEFTSTGAPTATFPATHGLNDILVLILQSSNEADVTAPTNYNRLGPQNGIGAAASAGSTKSHIFWKRDTGSESVPTIPDTGEHTYGVMLAIRGCPTTGDPFHFLGNAFKTTASTTGTSPKGATTVDACLILDIFVHAVDNASGQSSGQTNADLNSLTEQFDDGTTDGNGGGITVISGVKAEAGPIVSTTVTWANSTVDLCSRIAFLPADSVEVCSAPRPVEVQTFIGSPTDLDDVWVKPSGARKVLVQLCDGGGSGSGGRSSATAEGGGGGGGGGYDEAWYDAFDLAATISVHAGKGGASVAVDAAGNPGVLSEFDKGGSGPLTSARRIAGTAATATITADAGNGGCGSGRGLVSPAVATTRIDLTAATAGAALGAVGGRGGSATTTTIGGSPAEWGGGGGESGGDTDGSITAANNGWSLRGAGGGGGGRTNTNIGNGAMGGGAAAPAATQGQNGVDSTRLPFGGSGACGGGSAVPAGGTGGFPGGGGGGGGGVASGNGGRGGHGCVVVTTLF